MTLDQKIQQALHWWFYREFLKLFLESEQIRDDLLQESFKIRRNLDLLAINNQHLSGKKIQAYIQKIVTSSILFCFGILCVYNITRMVMPKQK